MKSRQPQQTKAAMQRQSTKISLTANIEGIVRKPEENKIRNGPGDIGKQSVLGAVPHTRDFHADASRAPCITANTSTRSAKTT